RCSRARLTGRALGSVAGRTRSALLVHLGRTFRHRRTAATLTTLATRFARRALGTLIAMRSTRRTLLAGFRSAILGRAQHALGPLGATHRPGRLALQALELVAGLLVQHRQGHGLEADFLTE